MKDNSASAPKDRWEKIYVCTHDKGKDHHKDAEQNILTDFKKLDFGNNLCTDPSDINYNDGKEANPFDKISKYYGRKKDVFMFISLLRNEEFSKTIADIIKEQCDGLKTAKFIERITLYVNRIKQGEKDAKDFLNSDCFPGAFFNGYHCGEKRNIHKNLNVNFTQTTQFLETGNVFNRTIDAMVKESSALKRVKIYDNGCRAVTVVNDQGKQNYRFTSDSSCQLVIKRLDYTIFLDIIAGEVVNIELEKCGHKSNPRSILEVDEIMNDETILINQNCLSKVLQKYFDEVQIQEGNCFVQEECLPIKTLEDLLKWSPPTCKHFTEHLHKRIPLHRPKTLVCHDMRGGYLEDRFIDGIKGEDDYFFVHWQAVDIFVYFSHNFVTIPPCSWISAAHKNGVQVLGTFITEWDAGAKICDEFLKDEISVHRLSMQLVNIATHYNFDGWLINIENRLKTRQIPLLRKFVSLLASKMHSFCPGSQVIWYDSVIKNGELKWQNALNDLNRMFFLACDGIFLNYNWKEEDLIQSVNAAGSRGWDVYVGVDVFGRGCLGGGGFSTNIAVAEARRFGLSVAIFAPGWVHECLDNKDFKNNQFKFWGALEVFSPARSLAELPYHSTFCPGFGKKMFRDGKIIANEPWHNLGLQSPQPIYSSPRKGSVELYNDDAYNGGGCIHFSGDTREQEFLDFQILNTMMKFDSDTVIVSYTFKPLLLNTEVILELEMKYGILYRLFLVVNDREAVGSSGIVKKMAPSPKEQVMRTGYKLKETLQGKEEWITRTYVLRNVLQHCVYDVSVKLTCTDSSSAPVSALFGELEIVPLQPRCNFTYTNLKCERDTTSSTVKVQCVLEWEHHSLVSCSDLYVEAVGKGEQYIGTTSQFTYKLEHEFPNIDYFLVTLCPRNPGNEHLPSVITRINIPS